MKHLLLLLLLVNSLTYAQNSREIASCCEKVSLSNKLVAEGRCSGDAYCTACTTCNYCKHCSNGGSCGVCTTYTTTESYNDENEESYGDEEESTNYEYTDEGDMDETSNSEPAYVPSETSTAGNSTPYESNEPIENSHPVASTSSEAVLPKDDKGISWGWYAFGALALLWIFTRKGK